jgi:hypothetical protein
MEGACPSWVVPEVFLFFWELPEIAFILRLAGEQFSNYFAKSAFHALCHNFSNADSFTRCRAISAFEDCIVHAAGFHCQLRASSLLPYMIRARLRFDITLSILAHRKVICRFCSPGVINEVPI